MYVQMYIEKVQMDGCIYLFHALIWREAINPVGLELINEVTGESVSLLWCYTCTYHSYTFALMIYYIMSLSLYLFSLCLCFKNIDHLLVLKLPSQHCTLLLWPMYTLFWHLLQNMTAPVLSNYACTNYKLYFVELMMKKFT